MAVLNLVNGCWFQALSSGEGSLEVGGALTGFSTPTEAGIKLGEQYGYRVETPNKASWEIGIGEFYENEGSLYLSRDVVLSNSLNSNSPVDFSEPPTVMLTMLSQHGFLQFRGEINTVEEFEAIYLAASEPGFFYTFATPMFVELIDTHFNVGDQLRARRSNTWEFVRVVSTEVAEEGVTEDTHALMVNPETGKMSTVGKPELISSLVTGSYTDLGSKVLFDKTFDSTNTTPLNISLADWDRVKYPYLVLLGRDIYYGRFNQAGIVLAVEGNGSTPVSYYLTGLNSEAASNIFEASVASSDSGITILNNHGGSNSDFSWNGTTQYIRLKDWYSGNEYIPTGGSLKVIACEVLPSVPSKTSTGEDNLVLLGTQDFSTSPTELLSIEFDRSQYAALYVFSDRTFSDNNEATLVLVGSKAGFGNLFNLELDNGGGTRHGATVIELEDKASHSYRYFYDTGYIPDFIRSDPIDGLNPEDTLITLQLELDSGYTFNSGSISLYGLKEFNAVTPAPEVSREIIDLANTPLVFEPDEFGSYVAELPLNLSALLTDTSHTLKFDLPIFNSFQALKALFSEETFTSHYSLEAEIAVFDELTENYAGATAYYSYAYRYEDFYEASSNLSSINTRYNSANKRFEVSTGLTEDFYGEPSLAELDTFEYEGASYSYASDVNAITGTTQPKVRMYLFINVDGADVDWPTITLDVGTITVIRNDGYDTRNVDTDIAVPSPLYETPKLKVIKDTDSLVVFDSNNGNTAATAEFLDFRKQLIDGEFFEGQHVELLNVVIPTDSTLNVALPEWDYITYPYLQLVFEGINAYAGYINFYNLNEDGDSLTLPVLKAEDVSSNQEIIIGRHGDKVFAFNTGYDQNNWNGYIDSPVYVPLNGSLMLNGYLPFMYEKANIKVRALTALNMAIQPKFLPNASYGVGTNLELDFTLGAPVDGGGHPNSIMIASSAISTGITPHINIHHTSYDPSENYHTPPLPFPTDEYSFIGSCVITHVGYGLEFKYFGVLAYLEGSAFAWKNITGTSGYLPLQDFFSTVNITVDGVVVSGSVEVYEVDKTESFLQETPPYNRDVTPFWSRTFDENTDYEEPGFEILPFMDSASYEQFLLEVKPNKELNIDDVLAASGYSLEDLKAAESWYLSVSFGIEAAPTDTVFISNDEEGYIHVEWYKGPSTSHLSKAGDHFAILRTGLDSLKTALIASAVIEGSFNDYIKAALEDTLMLESDIFGRNALYNNDETYVGLAAEVWVSSGDAITFQIPGYSVELEVSKITVPKRAYLGESGINQPNLVTKQPAKSLTSDDWVLGSNSNNQLAKFRVPVYGDVAGDLIVNSTEQSSGSYLLSFNVPDGCRYLELEISDLQARDYVVNDPESLQIQIYYPDETRTILTELVSVFEDFYAYLKGRVLIDLQKVSLATRSGVYVGNQVTPEGTTGNTNLISPMGEVDAGYNLEISGLAGISIDLCFVNATGFEGKFKVWALHERAEGSEAYVYPTPKKPYLYGDLIDIPQVFIPEEHGHDWDEVTSKPNFGTAALLNTGVNNGDIPVLGTNGKLNTSVLPALAIKDTFTVGSEAAMTALNAQVGDIAIRTDLSKTFALVIEPATSAVNWAELLSPTDAVTSVAGKIGVITLDKSDVGLGNVDNTSDADKPVSTATQTALNAKQDKFDGTFTVIPSSSSIELGTGNWVTTLTSGAAFSIGTAVEVGQLANVAITQDSTGSRIPTWSSAFVFGDYGTPILSTPAGHTDLLTFVAVSTTKYVFLGIRRNISM